MNSFPNCWVAPGGKLDKLNTKNLNEFETFENCLFREIKEEVGIDLR